MGRWVAVSCAIGLVGCATAASQGERDAVIQAQVACFKARAPILDDHTSDAGTIGRAVAAACSTQTGAVAEALSRGGNNYYLDQNILALASARARDAATEVVLLQRQAH